MAYYFVMPKAWKFFVSFEIPGGTGTLPLTVEAKVSEYLSLVMQLIFAFGLAFQLPILLTLLVRVGFLKTQTLIKGRRYAVVILLTVAAFITPRTSSAKSCFLSRFTRCMRSPSSSRAASSAAAPNARPSSMHDIKSIRENPAAFDAALARRGLEPLSKKLLALDEGKRDRKTELQQLQQRRNEVAKSIGTFMKSDPAKAEELKKEATEIKARIAAFEAESEGDAESAALTDELLRIPNILASDVPQGRDEHSNKELRVVGNKPAIANAKDHVALGEGLGLMDFESAAKISGARFVVLKGELAQLERALGNFMLDLHTREFGYQENIVPLLVRDHALQGTGQLPKFENDLFLTIRKLTEDEMSEELILAKKQIEQEKRGESPDIDMDTMLMFAHAGFKSMMNRFFEEQKWLIPTAEVSLTNLVREEILDASKLPMRLTAWTPCFRSEAGAAGKDTRGMIRQHQFSKVELVSITTPEESDSEHERMTACAEEVLKRLGLHYRVMLLCAGDTGFSARKTYDIEVWLPGQDAFREISSCSNCGDFQARRMKARYRKSEKETAFVHTLNGSGLAVGRTLIAVMENYQQADGSIAIPEALRPYMGSKSVIGKV